MIDLHLHFDGSLSAKTVWEQARKQGIELNVDSIEELKSKLICPVDCKSLNEYLEKFDLPLMVLQTEAGIRECMMELIEELISEGMLYAEIRFAPQLHLQKGLTQEAVIQAALSGVQDATAGHRIKVQLILCCMRGAENIQANMETVALCAKYLGKGICACDLAGAEALFKTECFESLFAYAVSQGVPFTIHAGEADGAKSVRDALQFGSRRIGHGVHAVEDEELMEMLQTEQICLECCPTSNVQTKAVLCIEEHPLKYFLDNGLLVTVNTDNRTVSNTTIWQEVQLLRDVFGLTKDEERTLYLNAVEAAFITEKEKEELRYAIQQII